jgi:hypothetical protein
MPEKCPVDIGAIVIGSLFLLFCLIYPALRRSEGGGEYTVGDRVLRWICIGISLLVIFCGVFGNAR